MTATRNEQQWRDIREIMTTAFAYAQQSDYWPWWAWPSQARFSDFGKDFQDWSMSPEPWYAIQDGSLAKRILQIASDVHKAFDDAQRMDLLMPVPEPITSVILPELAAVDTGAQVR